MTKKKKACKAWAIQFQNGDLHWQTFETKADADEMLLELATPKFLSGGYTGNFHAQSRSRQVRIMREFGIRSVRVVITRANPNA